MKANELMVGDWLSHSGNYEKIDALDNEHISTNAYMLSESYFEPISITDDILGIAGFTFNGDYSSWKLKNSTFNLFQYENRLMIHICGVMLEIKYVHELQHALRIGGLYGLANSLNLNGDED